MAAAAAAATAAGTAAAGAGLSTTERRVSVGLEVPFEQSLVPALDRAIATGFDFVATNLFHPRYERDAAGVSDGRDGPATRSDLIMPSDRWTTCVVAKVSPWISPDSPSVTLRTASERAFKQEVAWASHLGVPAIMLPPPTFDCANYAMLINQSVTASGFVHFWVTVPLSHTPTAAMEAEAEAEAGAAAAVDAAAAAAGADTTAAAPSTAGAGRPVAVKPPLLPSVSVSSSLESGRSAGAATLSGASTATGSTFSSHAGDMSGRGTVAGLTSASSTLTMATSGSGPMATSPTAAGASASGVSARAALERGSSGSASFSSLGGTSIGAAATARALDSSRSGHAGLPSSGSGGSPTFHEADAATARSAVGSIAGAATAAGSAIFSPRLSAGTEAEASADASVARAAAGAGAGASAAAGAGVPDMHPSLLSLLSSSDEGELAAATELAGPAPHFSAQLLRAAKHLTPDGLQQQLMTTRRGDDGARAALTLPARSREDTWHWWNNLRTLTEYHPHLSVALELTAELPPPTSLSRWLCEPMKAVIVPTHVFVFNKKGYPTLPKPHQQFLQAAHVRKAQFVICGRPSAPPLIVAQSGGDAYAPYLQFLVHVLKATTTLTIREDFESPYYDLLQAPLQPLMDNLESQTYETFERDPVKYTQYGLAVQAALADLSGDREYVVMVVGAGRGPLVQKVLDAAGATGRRVRVYAVEKNPNAIITLRNRKATSWGDRVTIIASDMRLWTPPELADILVSELLGSFGDNELSPECLDGAQRLLAPGGVSIPCEYTSYLAPIMSSKLWNEVKAYKEAKWFETAYVVRLFTYAPVAPPLPVFSFVHPNKADTIDNRRYARLRFTSSLDAVVHGFAGYFDARLYGDIHISINPETHTHGMFSWFPLYFPIKEPQFVAAGEVVEVAMWRCVSSAKVWYEWAMLSPDVSTIHNPTGRSYWIGL